LGTLDIIEKQTCTHSNGVQWPWVSDHLGAPNCCRYYTCKQNCFCSERL